ncbi:MAG TPA: hypothetical protein VG125_18195, partial [Pirellulales bacterium]|nr:hypothetical protein [Pirellulales bacterium]
PMRLLHKVLFMIAAMPETHLFLLRGGARSIGRCGPSPRFRRRRFVAAIVCVSVTFGWLPSDSASYDPGGRQVAIAAPPATDAAAPKAHDGQGSNHPVVRANWVVRSDLQRETQRRTPTHTSKSCQTVTALVNQACPMSGRDAKCQLWSSCTRGTSLAALHVRMQV